MPIIPDGFNDPDDLITSVTYVKAPEFVTMIETMMGKETFTRALNVYHSRYKHSNASSWDWIEVMEEVSGLELKDMAMTWLKQTQFPMVHVHSSYDENARTFTLFLRQEVQEGGKFWDFPFCAALVDSEGNDLAEVTEQMKGREKRIVITDVDRPAFSSLNRGYSFFGKVVHDVDIDELILQAKKDRDLINRFIAFYRIVDIEKMKLIEDKNRLPSKEFTDLYHELIQDNGLMEGAGAQFLTIFESVEDEKLAHQYQLLYEVKQKILKAIASRHEDSLMSLYRVYNEKENESENKDQDYLNEQVNKIKTRQVKNTSLSALSTLDTPAVHDIIREQFQTAQNATDKLSAFSYYLNSSAPDRIQLMQAFQKEAEKHPVSWEAFLRVIGSGSSNDVFDLVRQVESSGSFRIEQANDQRALYGSFAFNRKRSLQTEKGRELLGDIVLRLAEVNEYSTVGILNVLANIDRMEDEYHIPLVGMMVGFLNRLDKDHTPSVYNRIRKILLNTPKAVKSYEAVNGKINLSS